MQIEKTGPGPYAEVKEDGVEVAIALGDDSLNFDCNELQKDAQVTIDVVLGNDGKLCVGAENGSQYVANLIIPPARYETVDLPMTLEEEALPEDIDPGCITPKPTTETVRVPLAPEEMEAVRLILWTVNEISTQREMF